MTYTMQIQNEIKTISYLSNSSKLKGEEIEALLINIKDNNNRLGIGGVLIYSNETFFQVIEGDADQVESLFLKIKSDSRHFNVLKLFEIRTTHKKFKRFNFKYIDHHNEGVTNILMDFIKINDNFNNETHTMLVEKANFLLHESK